jgi:transcriptional regulator with XRE-family HTH domain
MTAARPDPERVYRTLGERIRSERLKQNITQDELASRVGLTRTSITNVEKGRQRLLVHTLLQIADSLGTDPARLLITFESETPIVFRKEISMPVRKWIMHSIGTSAAKHRDK